MKKLHDMISAINIRVTQVECELDELKHSVDSLDTSVEQKLSIVDRGIQKTVTSIKADFEGAFKKS